MRSEEGGSEEGTWYSPLPAPRSPLSHTRLSVANLLALTAVAAASFWVTFGYWWKYPRHHHIDALAHLPWMYRWHDPGLFPHDLVTDYFQTYHITPGLRAAYYLLFGLGGIDLPLASRLVAAGCFVAAFVLLVAVVRLDRPAGSWSATVAGVAAALLVVAVPRTELVSPFYWLAGGVSRAPAAAVLLLLAYGLARPSAAAVNLALVLGALTYPPALVLVAAAAVIDAAARRPARAAGRALLRLAPGAIAAAAVVALWYPLGVDDRFGPLVSWADVAWAPEIVPHHFPHGTTFAAAVVGPWLTANAPALAALAVLTALAGFDRFVRANATLLAAGLVTAAAAYALWPRLYDVDRYLTWPQRVVVVPTVAAVLARLAGRASGRWAAAAVAFSVAAALALGVYRLARFPAPPALPPAVIQFLAAEPVDVVVAAYPGDGDGVPLFARRPLLVHPVALYAYHRTFHRQAVARFTATRDAVYATDWAAVRRLRDEYGVRYLLVDRARFRPDRYAAGLTGHICLRPLAAAHHLDDLLARGADQPFVLRSPPAQAVVMEDGDYVVIDLTRIGERGA